MGSASEKITRKLAKDMKAKGFIAYQTYEDAAVASFKLKDWDMVIEYS